MKEDWPYKVFSAEGELLGEFRDKEHANKLADLFKDSYINSKPTVGLEVSTIRFSLLEME